MWLRPAPRGAFIAVNKFFTASSAKNFAIYPRPNHLALMTQPLALVVYEKLLPGTQVVNRLQDLNYRVQTVTDAETLVACAQAETPMLVVADLTSTHQDICALIARLRQNPSTSQIGRAHV